MGIYANIEAALRARLMALASTMAVTATLAADAKAGDDTISLSGASAEWQVGPGDAVQIAGDATPYIIAGEPVISQSSAFLGVQVAPVLAAPASAGTAVVVSCPFSGRVIPPNIPFDPNQNQDARAGMFWMTTDFMPGMPVQETLGELGENQQAGIFQVSLFVPEGIGLSVAYAIADRIASQFKRGTVVEAGGVQAETTRAYVGPGGPAGGPGGPKSPDGWFFLPVTVGWWAITQNV